MVRRAQGEDDRAAADFEEALRLEPRYASAYLYRGLSRRKEKEYDKAIADFEKAIEIEPARRVVHSHLAISSSSRPP